jgi:hypothetical protein
MQIKIKIINYDIFKKSGFYQLVKATFLALLRLLNKLAQ